MTTNLLNLNVDTLFEQHSVPEIDIIQKKIQAVVENKREELRTMVGERYRDLLQAADTITSMQNSAGILIQQVDEITASCQQQQVSGGFKNLENTATTPMYISQRNANKELNNYFSTMVQIKLLSSLPEMIWSKIDQEHFYAATELFVFSRHISTGLQLDANNELMRHLPVAKKQWEILKPFHMTIKQNVIAVLEREDLSAEIAADCLLSLLLLEKSSLNAVIKTFLQLRCTAYQTCLSGDVAGKAGVKELRRIKARIVASLKVLNDTMDLLSKCILPNNGLVYRKLAAITAAEAVPTLSYTEEAQHAHLLPEIIANFRPKFDLQPLDLVQAAACIEQWLQDTSRIANTELKDLFKLVGDMNTIQHIKSTANDLKNQLDLTALVAHFNLKQALDFHEMYYVPLINQRIRDIIQQNWAEAINATFEAIKQSLADKALDEQNIWQESASDLPASLEIALNDDRKVKSLLMRTKGYDGNILSICDTFDQQLAAIVAEMNVLLNEHNAKASDKQAMIEFLRNIAVQQLNDFLLKLKNLSLGNEQRKQLLFVIRCCTALIELCPNLKSCFCPLGSWRQWLNSAGQQATASLEHWQKLCLQFEAEVQEFWCTILAALIEEHNCELFMPKTLTAVTLMEDFVLWETITVQQQNELNDNISSNFRIPNQPRISLQTFLFDLINKLNLIVPETLPAKVVIAFNQMLLQQLLAHYEALATSMSTQLSANQNIALQLYFDLKFLQASFCVTAREARDLAERFQKLLTVFKDMVDPFDFELFAEYIAQNVKRAVNRLSCELGVLLPSDVAASGLSTVPASLAQEKDPNVLSLSTNASNTVWFPLLPIVTGTSNKFQSTITLETEKQTTSATPTRKSSSRKGHSDANQKNKSSATSFFGAMSQEWFR